MEPQSLIKTPVIPEFLTGGGELGQRIRDFDWATTPLGPVNTWPQSLRTCVRIMLTSRQPIWIGWGRELIKLYNDPYKAIVGGKHPWALGTPASNVWKDIWRDIEPMLKQVMEKDEGTYVESALLIMERNGYPEETYYTFSYTPIPGDNGGTAGMICANTDDTERIISERQLRTLTQLGKNLANCLSSEEVIDKTMASLEDNRYDFPYALFYLVNGDRAYLAHSTDLGAVVPSIPDEINLQDNNPLPESLRQAIANRKLHLFPDVKKHLGHLPTGAWPVSSDKAIILPIIQASSKDPYGFLVIGFNPYRLLDEKYSSFFSLVADQVATSFADVYILDEERKRSEALAEIDRAKTIFFSNISHEFRTPLTLMLGPVEDALSDPATPPENKMRLEVAYRNGLRMQKLVNTLLEFSRIEAGRVEGKFERVDINTITEDLASTFRSAIEKAGMSLQFHGGAVHDEVYVDPEMWERIVLNLISNAFKYCKTGGISIAVQQAGQEVHIAVSDTGVGIPEDQLDKIFDRFHRVENTEGRSQEGTGIGLAMVRELVKLHHGHIRVSSTTGKGSTFTVSLPVGKNHLPADKINTKAKGGASFKHSAAFVEEALKWIPEENRLPEAEEGDFEMAREKEAGKNKPTVLLADDNTDMRQYVQRLLSDQYTVITAGDGEEAFEKAMTYKPELLLSDIMMPRLDGFGLLKKMRNHPELKSTPVIFLSARAGEEAKVEGLDAGADDYLVKPFSAKELIVRVNNHIRINQVRRETEQQYYDLFMQAPAMINLFKGPEFVFDLYHPKNKELFGDVDFTGQPLKKALPELEGQDLLKYMEEVYTTGKTIQTTAQPILLRNAQGKMDKKYFNVTFQPWYDIRGNIQGVVNFSIDVTEVIRSKQKIEAIVDERTKELKRSNDDLQQFAHVASHDLKEPVRKFRTFINRLKEEYNDQLPEKGQLYIHKMQNAAERMSSMITGVLKYSSLQEAEEDITRINLNEVVKNIEYDLEIVINQKNAVINTGDLPVLEGAYVLIYQLFYNLVNNSLKFSDRKPIIDISSSTLSRNGAEYARIVIADNGIGFEQGYADKIFDAFTRLNSKDKFEGTGLGLALCKKIVERHQGTITAAGEPGKGAVFTIDLPLVQTEKMI